MTQPRIYVFESGPMRFNTKNFFYDNGEEVVVFDPQFTYAVAQKSIDCLRTKTNRPITYAVITHRSIDKFNGMSVFQALGAKVIASTKTPETMSAVHAYKEHFFVDVAGAVFGFTHDYFPKLAEVDITFGSSYDLRLRNGEVIQFRELSKPGISHNQTIGHIPSLIAVVVGDLVHYKAHAWIEGGIVNAKTTPT